MTIAYSNRYNAWSTRYSFEPTCYASTDNFFISSKDGEGVWEHDVNPKRCTFYGEGSGASIEVAANQDPSAVKIFKSISIETNENEWTAEVFTNDEYTGNERQEGSIDSFISKEGYKYADTPRSSINSSSNIVPYIGDMTLPNNEQSVNLLEGLTAALEDHVYAMFYFDSPISLPVSESLNVRIYSSQDGELQDPSVPGVPVSLKMYAHSILEGNVLVVLVDVSDSTFDQNNIYDFAEGALNGSSLAFVSPASVNGDSMRGPYLRTKITTTTTEPLELHAINVDYEFSKLDARLTQNT
jgi:hypothetical protein